MYPRNNASPPRIAIGPVVLIADGTVQTATVSISVTPEGGSAAAGGGTVSYVQGVVHYVPTQAETNYTAFTVTASKADCIPAAATIITSAASTSGQVVTDAASRDASKATGFSTHDAAAVVTALGTGSTLTSCATADVSDLPTNAELATALGTADDAMLAALAAIDTLIDGIKAKTDNLPADPATETTLATIDGLIDALTIEVGKIPRGASAIAAGGNATRTKVSANGTTLVEAIT